MPVEIGNWRVICRTCGHEDQLDESEIVKMQDIGLDERGDFHEFVALLRDNNTPVVISGEDDKMSINVSGFFDGTLDRMKHGAKIGAAGEATLLCVAMAEGMLGRELPLPAFLTSNLALAELAREFIGAQVVKFAAQTIGGPKSAVVRRVVELAETDIGVRGMHAFGPQIRARLEEFYSRAETLVSDKVPSMNEK